MPELSSVLTSFVLRNVPVLLQFICVGFIDENDAHIASWKSQIQEVDLGHADDCSCFTVLSVAAKFSKPFGGALGGFGNAHAGGALVFALS